MIIKQIILSSIFLLCISLIPAKPAWPEDINSYKQIIEKTLKYPRDAVYVLPAVLPDDTKTEEQNKELMSILKDMEKASEVRSQRKTNGRTAIKPNDGNEDVIGRELDMNYNVVTMNIIMGRWSIQLTDIKKDEKGRYWASGKKILTPSRLYNKILKSLLPATLKEYSTSSMIWSIEKIGAKHRIIEKFAP
jgi:hypothetical protein